MAGPESFYLNRTLIYLAAAASAEFIADVPLSPFEGIKVRTQTIPGFPARLRDAVPTIWNSEGMGGMFKTLVPLWGRQIPYTVWNQNQTAQNLLHGLSQILIEIIMIDSHFSIFKMVKFTTFERTLEFLYK